MERIGRYNTLGILPPQSASLNTPSEPVNFADIPSGGIQSLIDRMFEIAGGKQGDPERPTMVGLAAPQIGINKRIILVGIDATGNGEAPELQVFINPVITSATTETVAGREGCYSTSRVCGIVDRSKAIKVTAYDRHGKPITIEAEGFPARIFQHEIDHLDGIRFPDRITDPSRLHWVPVEQFGDYRQNWAAWTQLCPPEQWLAIKNGRVEQLNTVS